MAFAKVGNKAPAFSLLNQRGEKVSLKQFQGNKNVVVYFYPKAMTPGCTVQACGIRDTRASLLHWTPRLLPLALTPSIDWSNLKISRN